MRAGALHVAITADPEIAVPPRLYGGIERIVDMLVRGLVGGGHTVTLFAHAESSSPCRVIPYPSSSSTSSTGVVFNTMLVSSKVWREKFDVVHSFSRVAYMLPVLPASVPKVMSYQREVTDRSVEWATRLSRGTLHFTGCSRHLVRRFLGRRNWHVVYNGVPADKYRFRASIADDAPLVFLGRLEEIKGPHLAIEVARRAARRLVLAGNIPSGDAHRNFFDTRIAPHVDGTQVEFLGPVTDVEKNDLLGRAAALLMPILWDEPFGIVMAESLACGTPVIGLNRGSVPEVVQHGLNGFVCDSVDDMIRSVQRIVTIDRAICRRVMEQRFSDSAIVGAYERLYYALSRPRSKVA